MRSTNSRQAPPTLDRLASANQPGPPVQSTCRCTTSAARTSRVAPSAISTTNAPSSPTSTAVPTTSSPRPSARTVRPTVADLARCASRSLASPSGPSMSEIRPSKVSRTWTSRSDGSMIKPKPARDTAPGGASSPGPGQPTLTPIPTTTAGPLPTGPPTSSARMPANLPAG